MLALTSWIWGWETPSDYPNVPFWHISRGAWGDNSAMTWENVRNGISNPGLTYYWKKYQPYGSVPGLSFVNSVRLVSIPDGNYNLRKEIRSGACWGTNTITNHAFSSTGGEEIEMAFDTTGALANEEGAISIQ
jgi:hypothetical protein